MTRRRLVRLLALAAPLAAPAFLSAQESDLQEALAALERGAEEEALQKLQQILAADPSNEAAFELWSNTETQVWLRLLTQGGEVELVARELAERAKLGRKQRQNNPDAIREKVKELATDDVIARTRVVNELASDYGEFAVPILIFSLAEGGAEERRTSVIQALTRMGSDVVPPLIEAMDSPDAILRRNVAVTLGYIKDPRARAVLARAVSLDADSGVKSAATKALPMVGGGSDAGALYLELGEAYYREDDRVLAPHQYSDVIWRWEGNGLAATETPRFLYAPEMAKKSYYDALALLTDPGPALAGIARCAVTEIGRLDEWLAAGQEAGDWRERLQSDELAAQLAGPDALDTALGWAIGKDDWVAASGLCRLLAGVGKAPTTNLAGALGASSSGAVQGEAAVALGSIAYRSRASATPETVDALTRFAGKEILRIGAVIGGEERDGRAQASELGELGYQSSWWSTGARGLVALHTMPGVDLIVVNEKLPDMTARQVVNEIRTQPRFSQARIYVKTAAADGDAPAFGDKITGLLAPGDSLTAAAEAAAGEPLNRDRQEALGLAARSAETLHRLAAGAKTDVDSSAEALAGILGDRPDEVVLPALSVLEFVGGAEHAQRVAAVLTDAARSEPARVRAAQALAGIFARSGGTDTAVVGAVQEVAKADGSFAVRAATAGALGRLDLERGTRVELMRALIER